MTFEEEIKTLTENLNDISTLTMLLATLNKQESDILKGLINKIKTMEMEKANALILSGIIPKDLINHLENNRVSSEKNAKELVSASKAFKNLANSLEVKD